MQTKQARETKQATGKNKTLPPYQKCATLAVSKATKPNPIGLKIVVDSGTKCATIDLT